MRKDIQSLRGIAIISVLLYHLFPTLFVNGFLGVDIFFVISGYLMARNLTKTKVLSCQNVGLFYYRRFKRILPLYFLVILITLLLVRFYLEDFLWENNDRYALASLFMVTNELVIKDQGDYFREFQAERSSLNVFVHLWSLSVEMQFYLIVPFIFIGFSFLKKDCLKLISSSLIFFVGFYFFAIINPQYSFNFMFLRLWQFSAGFIALFCSNILISPEKESLEEGNVKKQSNTSTKKELLVIIYLMALLLCAFPEKINSETLRPLITISTAFVIILDSNNNALLQSEILGYIGDISYVMYLVHWPILSIFITASLQRHILCIMLIFATSITLHHFFEKIYLKLSWKGVSILLAVLILSNGYLQYSIRFDDFWKTTIPSDIKEIVEKNKESFEILWKIEEQRDSCVDTHIDHPQEYVYGYCQFPQGDGNFSVMMIGNSYVMNLGEHIRASFNYSYSDYSYVAINEGYGIYEDSPISMIGLTTLKKQVEAQKPDVLFIVSRYTRALKTEVREYDIYVKQINETITFYEKYVKRIYILDALPLYNLGFLNLYLHYLIQKPEELESLHLKKKVADDEMKNVKKRFRMVKCRKCKFFDLSSAFLEDDKYLSFDRISRLSYIDNTIHFTASGVEKCQNLFDELAEEVLSEMESL